MPESRRRKKRKQSAPEHAPTPPQPSGQWLPITAVVLMCLGLAWLIVFYVAGSSVPLISDLRNWNIGVGMGLIVVGFMLLTRWQ